MNLGLLFGLGGQEILIIALVVILLFGATKIPQLMRGLGQGVKEFKQAVNESDQESESSNGDDKPASDG